RFICPVRILPYFYTHIADIVLYEVSDFPNEFRRIRFGLLPEAFDKPMQFAPFYRMRDRIYLRCPTCYCLPAFKFRAFDALPRTMPIRGVRLIIYFFCTRYIPGIRSCIAQILLGSLRSPLKTLK